MRTIAERFEMDVVRDVVRDVWNVEVYGTVLVVHIPPSS